MDIVVCVKQVVDTEAALEVDAAGEVVTEGQTLVIDPYSEFAVERAVQLTEEVGGTVTLLCVGDEGCAATVRHGLAMGAHEAVILTDEAWRTRDAAVCAAQLAGAIEPLEPDMVMGGWKSGDTAAAQVMGRLGVLLNMPVATMATAVVLEDRTARGLRGGRRHRGRRAAAALRDRRPTGPGRAALPLGARRDAGPSQEDRDARRPGGGGAEGRRGARGVAHAEAAAGRRPHRRGQRRGGRGRHRAPARRRGEGARLGAKFRVPAGAELIRCRPAGD